MGHQAGKLARLVDLIDRFGGPIEADLLDRGFNLIDWFSGRYPLTQLCRLVDRLPAHSRYVAALLDDPVEAERMAGSGLPDEDEKKKQPDMGMEGFDQTARLLTDLIDAVQVNTAYTIAAAGADPPDFDPMPRPVTELQRVRNRRFEQARDKARAKVLSMLLPGQVEHADSVPPGWGGNELTD